MGKRKVGDDWSGRTGSGKARKIKPKEVRANQSLLNIAEQLRRLLALHQCSVAVHGFLLKRRTCTETFFSANVDGIEIESRIFKDIKFCMYTSSTSKLRGPNNMIQGSFRAMSGSRASARTTWKSLSMRMEVTSKLSAGAKHGLS